MTTQVWILLTKVTAPHLLQHRLRTFLTFSTIALGVAAIVGLGTVSESVLQSARQAVTDVAGRSQLAVTNATAGVPEEMLEQVRGTPGVEAAVGVIDVTASFPSPIDEYVQILGVDLLDDQTVRIYDAPKEERRLGDPLDLIAKPNSMLLTYAFAARHRLAIDDEIEVLTPEGKRTFRVAGLLKASGPARAYGGNIVVMDVYAAQLKFGRPGVFSRIDIVVGQGRDVDQVRRALAERLGSAALVQDPEGLGVCTRQILDSIAMAMRFSSVIGLVVALFLIYTSQSISVVQRRRDLAVLRAVGVTRRRLASYVIIESLLIAAPACLLGLPIGHLEARLILPVIGDAISSDIQNLGHVSLSLAYGDQLLACALGLLAAFLGAATPARSAATVSPVEAMGQQREVMHAGHDGRAALVGTLVLAAGMLLPAVHSTERGAIGVLHFPMLGLGATLCLPYLLRRMAPWWAHVLEFISAAPAKLASRSVTAAPRLSAATTATVMLVTAAVIALRVLLNGLAVSAEQWGDRFFPMDLMLTSGSPMFNLHANPMPGALAHEFEVIDGVSAVNPLRIVENVACEGGFVSLVAQDWGLWRQRGGDQPLYEGVVEEALAGLERGEILVSTAVARRAGARLGDTVRIQTSHGEQRFRVAGVYGPGFLSAPDGTVAMALATYRRLWEDDRVTTFNLFFQPGADGAAIADEIRRRFGVQYELFALSRQTFRQLGLERLAQPYRVAQALDGLIALLAGFGVLNTLLASVIGRWREIGLLRSMGATRAQVSLSVLLEALLLGLVGLTAGTALGLLVSRSLVDVFAAVGWDLPWVVPVAAVVLEVAAVLAVVLVAGWYPARCAARQSIAACVHNL